MSDRGRSGALLTRLGRAWRALAPEGRMAALAALALFATMFLPWYQQNAIADGRIVSPNLTAFGVFSFVEAAVLLVAVAVLALLFARAEGRAFHLPGGDGTVVAAAGGWVALLLVWRLFDKPSLSGGAVGTVGVQWGIFFALAAAGLLIAAGSRMRAAQRPEPGLTVEPARPRRRRPPAPAGAPGTERTRPLPPDRPRPAAPAGPPTGRVVSERWPEEPPTVRLADPPTERLPAADRGADRPPAARPRRIRARRPEPTERLFDDD